MTLLNVCYCLKLTSDGSKIDWVYLVACERLLRLKQLFLKLILTVHAIEVQQITGRL